MIKRDKARKRGQEPDVLTLSTLRRQFEKTDRRIAKASIMKAVAKLGVRLKEREDGVVAIGAQLSRMRDDDLSSKWGARISRHVSELTKSVARMPEELQQLNRADLEELLLEVGVQVCVLNQIEEDLRWAQASALLDAQIGSGRRS